MNLIKVITVCGLISLSATALACESPLCKKVMADTTINDRVKKEVITYFEKDEAVVTEFKAKRKQLRDGLSQEAKDAIKSQRKRGNKKPKASDDLSAPQPKAKQIK